MDPHHQHKSGMVEVARSRGGASIVLICEHASAFIPPELQDLGLSDAARYSHAAWDPGAFDLARSMARALDATLIACGVSRLVFDCNRPADAPDAVRARSEAFDIPGNRNLGPAEIAARAERFYDPFKAAIDAELARVATPVIITVHSFAPVYEGRTRAVEIGVLHDTDTRLADAILDQANTHIVRRNDPYGPLDGVTHTLRVHALPAGHLNVMLEVRNDLIATPDQQEAMAHLLSGWITAALKTLGARPCSA